MKKVLSGHHAWDHASKRLRGRTKGKIELPMEKLDNNQDLLTKSTDLLE